MPIDRYELRRVLLARREELSREVALDPTETIELDQARVGRLSRAEAMQDHQMALENGTSAKRHAGGHRRRAAPR